MNGIWHPGTLIAGLAALTRIVSSRAALHAQELGGSSLTDAAGWFLPAGLPRVGAVMAYNLRR